MEMTCQRAALDQACHRQTSRGTAISAAMKPERPLTQLFVDTADDDRPVFASTMYARVLE